MRPFAHLGNEQKIDAAWPCYSYSLTIPKRRDTSTNTPRYLSVVYGSILSRAGPARAVISKS